MEGCGVQAQHCTVTAIVMIVLSPEQSESVFVQACRSLQNLIPSNTGLGW